MMFIAAIAILVIVFAILGLVAGIVGAFLYNSVAGKIGGIKIKLQ